MTSSRHWRIGVIGRRFSGDRCRHDAARFRPLAFTSMPVKTWVSGGDGRRPFRAQSIQSGSRDDPSQFACRRSAVRGPAPHLRRSGERADRHSGGRGRQGPARRRGRHHRLGPGRPGRAAHRSPPGRPSRFRHHGGAATGWSSTSPATRSTPGSTRCSRRRSSRSRSAPSSTIAKAPWSARSKRSTTQTVTIRVGERQVQIQKAAVGSGPSGLVIGTTLAELQAQLAAPPAPQPEAAN